MNMHPMNAMGFAPRSMACAVRAAVLGMGLVMALPAAHADGDEVPLYLTLTQQFQHDNNLLKDNRRKVSDLVSASQVRVGVDKSYGRQHYNLDAKVAKNKYKNNSKFDNDSHTASGSFVSELLADFRVSLTGRSSRELPNFETNVATRSAKNVERQTSMGVDLRYGLHGRMSVNAGFNKSRLRYDATTYDNRDTRSANVGVRYSPSDLLYFGLSYTKGNTDMPNIEVLQGVGDKIDRDSLSLNSSWVVTGFSTFSGSIGATRERFERDERRDFNGLTGSATWRYSPPGKVVYNFSWVRDTNNEGGRSATYSAGSQSFSGYSVANKLVNRFVASADWQATSKIALSATYTYARYEEEKDAIIPGVIVSGFAVRSTGIYNSLALGLDYTPIDSVQTGCSLTAYDRTKSLYSESYDGRVIGCYAGFTFQ